MAWGNRKEERGQRWEEEGRFIERRAHTPLLLGLNITSSYDSTMRILYCCWLPPAFTSLRRRRRDTRNAGDARCAGDAVKTQEKDNNIKRAGRLCFTSCVHITAQETQGHTQRRRRKVRRRRSEDARERQQHQESRKVVLQWATIQENLIICWDQVVRVCLL